MIEFPSAPPPARRPGARLPLPAKAWQHVAALLLREQGNRPARRLPLKPRAIFTATYCRGDKRCWAPRRGATPGCFWPASRDSPLALGKREEQRVACWSPQEDAGHHPQATKSSSCGLLGRGSGTHLEQLRRARILPAGPQGKRCPSVPQPAESRAARPDRAAEARLWTGQEWARTAAPAPGLRQELPQRHLGNAAGTEMAPGGGPGGRRL